MGIKLVNSGGSAALLSLFDGLDLLDPFEVTRDFLLQKRLEHQVRQRGLGVQQNLRYYLTVVTIYSKDNVSCTLLERL